MWALFHQAHDREFGYSYAGEQEVELVNLRVQAVGNIHRPAVDMGDAVSSPWASGNVKQREVPHRTRPTYLRAKGWLDSAVVERATLHPGAMLGGPVIVEEYGSTVVVPEGWTAVCDKAYNLLLDRGRG